MGHRIVLVVCSILVAAVAATPSAAEPSAAKLEAKACKLATKTMGCTVETGLAGIEAGIRGDAVVSGGPLPGKCEIDSPGIAPVIETAIVPDVTCDDPSLADTGDIMIGLCKTAAASARSNCKTTCAKLEKIDPSTGDVVPDSPCHFVVDRTVVTTATENHGPRVSMEGVEGCALTCTASIICVCDP